MNSLIPSISLEAFVASYEAAAKALADMAEAGARFDAAHKQWDIRCPRAIVHYGSRELPAGEDQTVVRLRLSFWKRLYEATGIQAHMSAARREQLFKTLNPPDYENAEAPPLTVENIEAVFEQIRSTRAAEFDHLVLDVLRKVSSDYKTNSPRGVKRRLILSNAIAYWQRDHIDHWTPSNVEDLRALETVLWLLVEGKVPPNNAGIHDEHVKRAAWGEWVDVAGPDGTVIMRVKGHRVGTVHVNLLCDQECIDEINRTAAKHFPGRLVW